MKKLLPTIWLTRGWLACLLWPLAQLHKVLVRLRWALYRSGYFESQRFSAPIIVIGNVVAGGAGKTPLVIALVTHLQRQGLKVGVVSRGYGRTGNDTLEVQLKTPVYESGDEPAVIKQATSAPVFIATRRTEAVRCLLAAYPETAVVVCDDGLQHYALQRDIEIAVFDDRGVGNGWLLPAGPLREPWPERKKHGINLVVHTGQKPAFEGFSSNRELASEAVTANGNHIPLIDLIGVPLIALAGIANPKTFFAMLEVRGLTLEKTFSFPDHHTFSDDAVFLNMLSGRTVLCTEKDAVKLFALHSASKLNLLAVPLNFSPEPAFYSALEEILTPLLSQLTSNNGHQTT